ncbi:MAG: response regulator, partial [Spirochaetia bacterium]|nr:response regulator [Spirochaetia bacterium]
MNRKVPEILIVDDVKTNLLILRTILGKEGFNVLEAQDGITAMELALNNIPDLILLDIMMPGEDGFETCSKLKADSLTASIPVIFISALSDIEKKVKGFELGAVDYITKPFESAEVLIRTKLHLRLSRARKNLIEDQRNRLKQLTKAQQDILVKPENLPKANFAVKYLPMLEAGGDFYDVIPFNE